METFVKFNQEAQAKFVEQISTDAMKMFVENTKSATDSGTFEMVISTDDIDRMGESIKIDGWDTSLYMKSPVVLWGHNYSLMPVGITDSLSVQGNKLIAKGRFAPTEMGQTLRKLYDMGMLKASSVGFMALEQEGNIITKSQLLEWSFVSVPANPYALSLRELDGIKSPYVAELILKSIEDKIKIGAITEKEGDEIIPPAEEVPAEVTPEIEVTPTEQKGAVADELTAEQKMEAKYQNLDKVFDVVFAFCDVYMNEGTAVEDFTKLLTETISILSTVSNGSYTDDSQKGLVYDGIKSITKEKRDERNIALKNIVTSKSDDGSTANEDDEDDGEIDEDDYDDAEKALARRKLLQEVQTIVKTALTDLKPKIKQLY